MTLCGHWLTCADAVEVSGREVVDPSSLELEGAGAVQRGHRGVGLLHPVHQPLDLTVTAERVPPQVPERSATTYSEQRVSAGLDPHSPRSLCHHPFLFKPSLITGTIFSFSIVSLVSLWNNCDDEVNKLTAILKLKKLFRNQILNCSELELDFCFAASCLIVLVNLFQYFFGFVQKLWLVLTYELKIRHRLIQT